MNRIAILLLCSCTTTTTLDTARQEVADQCGPSPTRPDHGEVVEVRDDVTLVCVTWVDYGSLSDYGAELSNWTACVEGRSDYVQGFHGYPTRGDR